MNRLQILSEHTLLVLNAVFASERLQANLLQNGSFDNGFTDWTLQGGGLVTINDSSTTQQYAGGSTGAVGLAGTSTLFQDISTVVGQQYSFSFYLAEWGPNYIPDYVMELDPSFGSVSLGQVDFNGSGKTFLNMGWEQFVYTVTATSTTTEVSFYNPLSNYADDGWPAIDAVVVTPMPENAGIGVYLISLLFLVSFGYLRHRISPV
ncbi:MAG: DUF642 domain-containing protein [Verrucomicrobiota bacterium]